MPPQHPATSDTSSLDFAVMRRFIPYLWPKDAPGLRGRIVLAMLLVLASKAVQLSMGFVYGRAIDRMTPDTRVGSARPPPHCAGCGLCRRALFRRAV